MFLLFERGVWGGMEFGGGFGFGGARNANGRITSRAKWRVNEGG